MHPRAPLTRVNGVRITQWQVPNVAGHRQMVRAGGFEIVRTTKPFRVEFGPGHRRSTERPKLTTLVTRTIVSGGDGVPHAAVLARVPR